MFILNYLLSLTVVLLLLLLVGLGILDASTGRMKATTATAELILRCSMIMIIRSSNAGLSASYYISKLVNSFSYMNNEMHGQLWLFLDEETSGKTISSAGRGHFQCYISFTIYHQTLFLKYTLISRMCWQQQANISQPNQRWHLMSMSLQNGSRHTLFQRSKSSTSVNILSAHVMMHMVMELRCPGQLLYIGIFLLLIFISDLCFRLQNAYKAAHWNVKYQMRALIHNLILDDISGHILTAMPQLLKRPIFFLFFVQCRTSENSRAQLDCIMLIHISLRNNVGMLK